MRRILISVAVSLLLLCGVVGLKNLVAQQAGHSPVVLASGGSPPPPIPE